MHNRWCIIAGPRSGSTWLEFIFLEHLKSINKNSLRLGEFFHLSIAKHEQFELTKNNHIITGHEHFDSDELLFNNRLSMIAKNDNSQFLTMRLFPQNYIFDFIDYVNVVSVLKNSNFKFISLYRNIFDRAVSWSVMEKTHIVHLFKINNIEHHTTYLGERKKTLMDPFYLCTKTFTKFLLLSLQDDINRRILGNIVGAIEVNYDTLEQDIFSNFGFKLPITKIQQVHELPYHELVTNYDQLLNIYNTLKTTRDFNYNEN